MTRFLVECTHCCTLDPRIGARRLPSSGETATAR